MRKLNNGGLLTKWSLLYEDAMIGLGRRYDGIFAGGIWLCGIPFENLIAEIKTQIGHEKTWPLLSNNAVLMDLGLGIFTWRQTNSKNGVSYVGERKCPYFEKQLFKWWAWSKRTDTYKAPLAEKKCSRWLALGFLHLYRRRVAYSGSWSKEIRCWFGILWWKGPLSGFRDCKRLESRPLLAMWFTAPYSTKILILLRRPAARSPCRSGRNCWVVWIRPSAHTTHQAFDVDRVCCRHFEKTHKKRTLNNRIKNRGFYMSLTREANGAKRVAQELQDGFYVILCIVFPTLVANFRRA